MPYKDPEQAKAFYREWKKGSKKRQSNKYYDAAKHANARAVMYGVSGHVSTQDVREVLDGSRCFYCGVADGGHHGRGPKRDTLGIDHRVALANGGLNTSENLVACCHSCNASKYRSDRPRRWSRAHDACIECESTERKHDSHGRCTRCALRYRKKDHAEAHP